LVRSNQGVAIKGVNMSETASGTEEWATGVQGESSSPQGIGVIGQAVSLTGQVAGVAGVTRSPAGWGGIFINEGGGALLAATGDNTDLTNLPFRVENDGTTLVGPFLGLKPIDSPGTCAEGNEGYIYFDDSINELCFCPGVGGVWLPVDGSGTCD
jgi:hypothetical protein